MKPEITSDQARLRLESLCVRGEQCAHDVREKLRRWGIGEAEAGKIVARLEREGFVDAERYCRAYVRDKFRYNRWGRIKIRAMLRSKRLPDDKISLAIAEEITDTAYRAALDELLVKKSRSLTKRQAQQRLQALVAFAGSRGFEADLAFEAARTVITANDDDDTADTMD